MLHKQDIDQLKILIVSTPKTGNTWLSNLLAAIYDVPIKELDLTFKADQANQLGRRWLVQQHFTPTSGLIDWAARNRVTLLTTIRHPADVLVSLLHFTRSYFDAPNMDLDVVRTMVNDLGALGENTIDYVARHFWRYLNISASWIWSGKSTVVRYEDLWRDTVGVMKEMTDALCPVPTELIERAADQCDINLMRELNDTKRSFFRQGKIGGWRDSVPQAIVDMMRERDPYPALFRSMGYTLDPNDPLIAAPAKPRTMHNPFLGLTHFDNGVPILPLVVKLYLTLDSARTHDWAPVADTTSPNSFWAWLNAPSDADLRRPAGEPYISNAAAYLYRLRPDLEQAMPDLYGADRLEFVKWFVRHAQLDFKFDKALIAPMLDSYQEWCCRPAAGFNQDTTLPVVTNLVALLHQQRADVRAKWPDLRGKDRITYLVWFVSYAHAEHRLDAPCVTPVRESLLQWANTPAPEDSRLKPGIPAITHAMAYIWRTHPGVKQTYRDLFGRHRNDFIRWFMWYGQWESELTTVYSIPVDQKFKRWAHAPSEDDPRRGSAKPVITNLMAYIYQTRSDLQEQFPDLYGKDRVNFAAWLLVFGCDRYPLGSVLTEPLLASWSQH